MPITFTTTLPDESPASVVTENSNTIDVERAGTPSNNGNVRAQLIDPNDNVLQENVISYSTLNTNFSPLANGDRYFVRTRTETPHVTGSWATATKDISRNGSYYGAAGASVGNRSVAKQRNGALSVVAAVASDGFNFSGIPTSVSSDDLTFEYITDPFLAFASERVEEESIFGNETDAFTVILDAYVNDYITVRVQYRETEDSRAYTTSPRKVRRDGEVETFEELGDDGEYRLLLSDMSSNDHLRAVTWGPTRF